MPEIILVTGADGFLGSHIVRRAIDCGYQVRAFLQPGRNTGTLEGLPIESFSGDLTVEQDLTDAVQGCDFLIHTAASTAVWPNRSTKMWQINFDVVEKLAKAVLHHGIKRFVHIGSASSFGYGTKLAPGDEDSPFLGKCFNMDYLDSKKAAHDFLLEQYKQKGLPVIILAPTFMIGDYDTAPGSGKMVITVARHKIPGYASGGKCVVYPGDVAQAALNALTQGRLGECYITGGENLTYHEFFDLITKVAQVPPIRMRIPTGLAIVIGNLLEIISKFSHKEPMLSATMASMSGDTHFYTSAKAIRELGLPQSSAMEAVRRSIDYFKRIGYL
jgi:dihydroflavonol-4-reductase